MILRYLTKGTKNEKLSLLLFGFIFGSSLCASEFMHEEDQVSLARVIVSRCKHAYLAEMIEVVRQTLPFVSSHEKFGSPVRSATEFPPAAIEYSNRIKALNARRAEQSLGVMKTAADFKEETGEDYQPYYFVYSDVMRNAYPNGHKWADPVFGPDTTLRQIRDVMKEHEVGGRKRTIPVDELFEEYSEEELDKRLCEFVFNPNGITGLIGVGEWGYIKRNITVDPWVATHDSEGELLALITIRADTQEPAWPGGVVEDLSMPFSRVALKELNEETNMPASELLTKGHLRMLGKIFEGIMDDGRNSDHAWSQNMAFAYYLDPAALTPDVQEALRRTGDETLCSRWVRVKDVIDGKIKMFGAHNATAREAMRFIFQRAGMI